jgi:WYL domain
MSQLALCGAIASRHLVQFYYSGDKAPGTRIVEPHMVAYNQKDNLTLSAWYLSGESESQRGEGWRQYLLGDISDVTILPRQFGGPRPDYKPDGGKIFHNIQCGL